MLYLISTMIAGAVVLGVFSTALLLAGREREGAVRRLERMQGMPARGRGAARVELRGHATAALRSFGDRFVASRKNLEELRLTLTQAGLRGPYALQTYFAVRALVMLGTMAVSLLLVPVLTGSPASGFLALPYLVGIAWFAPRLWLRRRVTARKQALQNALPDTLDLLVLCVEAGLGLNQAMVRVGKEIEHVSPEMAGELRTLNLEIQAGSARDVAFRNLGSRTGVEDLQSLATMLIQADRFGTSVAQALRVQAETLRSKRRQRAEEAAAKTTIKLVFPLVLFIFPALGVVVLGPAMLLIVRELAGVVG
jgi:tight adherence protein C